MIGLNPLLSLLSSIVGIIAVLILARLSLAWVRAPLQNPIAKGIHRITQPIIAPLKLVLRNIGRFELASFVALLALAVIDAGLRSGFGLSIWTWMITSLAITIDWIYWFYFIAIIIMALMSWISTDPYHPLTTTLMQITDPVCRPVRKIMLRFTGNLGIDFSPMVVLLGMMFIRGVLMDILSSIA